MCRCVTVSLRYCVVALLCLCVAVSLRCCVFALLCLCVTMFIASLCYCVFALMCRCVTVSLRYCVFALLCLCVAVSLRCCVFALLCLCVAVSLRCCVFALLCLCVAVSLRYPVYCVFALLLLRRRVASFIPFPHLLLHGEDPSKWFVGLRHFVQLVFFSDIYVRISDSLLANFVVFLKRGLNTIRKMIEARSFSPRCAIAWLSSREKNFKTPSLVVRHFFFRLSFFVFISSFLFFLFFPLPFAGNARRGTGRLTEEVVRECLSPSGFLF